MDRTTPNHRQTSGGGQVPGVKLTETTSNNRDHLEAS